MKRIAEFTETATRFLALLAPAADLLLRLWVANVFFKSGLTKIRSWDSTLHLFSGECDWCYQVPLLPPVLAAYLGTGAELILPVLLALGLGGRLAAAALFVFNIVALISLPEVRPVDLMNHQLWGLMLLFPILYGPGKISVDHFIRRRCIKTGAL